jgi:anaerobic ribonucleoside-triphosphate reductase activating protein
MRQADTALNVHHIAKCSQANGPGIRFTIWVQGCSIGCPGCFNPETHSSDVRRTITVVNLLEQIHAQLAANNITGITLSGGEPFDQPKAILQLLQEVKQTSSLYCGLFRLHPSANSRNGLRTQTSQGNRHAHCRAILPDPPK